MDDMSVPQNHGKHLESTLAVRCIMGHKPLSLGDVSSGMGQTKNYAPQIIILPTDGFCQLFLITAIYIQVFGLTCEPHL